uniref:Uncharacterized protein n=1 Tax=Utricularia reniformis TaxID=192314 RepID=A0A1Y0B163_9LAMI|nr:hypothetical protein AEK19_MT0871 [Utricularia reniformis]YP_009382264.1 hypothetical protein AEK19_MT1838 [Utricularia reniformis]ART31103.1 hypothetical protein AEK19_MT0871 [Utricularia reniformis]ART32008.1 hypothetical protein AEK19_MT1838 [Utricularia reniformis]
MSKTLCPNQGKLLCLRRKKERSILEQPLRVRDRGCHKPRSPTEIREIS